MHAILLVSAALALGHCETNCKVRIYACDIVTQNKCFYEDIHVPPAWATFCSPAVSMAAANEWKLNNPRKEFKSTKCVPLDDEMI